MPQEISDAEQRIVSIIDITGYKRLEREIEKIHKLESVGILAGGIAHDFNNMLTAILGNISLTKMHMRPDSKDFMRLYALR